MGSPLWLEVTYSLMEGYLEIMFHEFTFMTQHLQRAAREVTRSYRSPLLKSNQKEEKNRREKMRESGKKGG